MDCVFCREISGDELYRNGLFRVVLADEPDFPGFLRLILNRHQTEMTQLLEEERGQIMEALWALEASLLEVMKPSKVNIASLGNMTPHIHWHVIPRYRDDAYFPGSVWSARLRDVDEAQLVERRGLATKLGPAITDRLS